MFCVYCTQPDVARGIFADAVRSKQPLCVFEISDNGPPIALWWLALLPGFLMPFVLTLWVRPLRWYQLVLTYVVPLLPALIAWDGAVSNARTYTADDHAAC